MNKPERICKTEDDDGDVCNRTVSKKQWEQDGMCSRCAEGLWSTFCLPLSKNEPVKPFLFKEK